MTEVHLGYIKDPSDYRDGAFAWDERYGKSLPIEKSVDLWFHGMHIRSQGPTSSCTGYAGAAAVQLALYHDTGRDPGVMSGVYLYYTGRATWDGQKEDGGSYVRSLFKALQVQGAANEAVFSGDVGVFKEPTWKAAKNAFQHRGIRSYRPVYNEDEARAALSRGCPLVGGWDVGRVFIDWKGGAAYNGESTSVGGHAICVTGYKENGDFVLANSWGVNRGEDGFWRVTPEWLLSGGRLWACDTEKQ
jgi:hypothetical protein